MHAGRGNAAPKTEAMHFSPPRRVYEAVETSRFYIDGTGFIDIFDKSSTWAQCSTTHLSLIL